MGLCPGATLTRLGYRPATKTAFNSLVFCELRLASRHTGSSEGGPPLRLSIRGLKGCLLDDDSGLLVEDDASEDEPPRGAGMFFLPPRPEDEPPPLPPPGPREPPLPARAPRNPASCSNCANCVRRSAIPSSVRKLRKLSLVNAISAPRPRDLASIHAVNKTRRHSSCLLYENKNKLTVERV